MATHQEVPLARLLESLVGLEASQIMSLAGIPTPPTYRFNPLKHTREFHERLLKAEGFSICRTSQEDAFESPSGDLPVGKSLAHFLGGIYIQDLSSMLPPLILGARPGETVLDLCAAPGSKTTQIAAMMGNSGVLVANDVSSSRLKALVFNLRRIGAINTLITRFFGEQFGNHYFETFDRVLVDPPCSAMGTLRKSPGILNWWQSERTERLAVNQRNLLLSGLKSLKPGGVLVYSTCTLHPGENEEVLSCVLEGLPVEIEPIPDLGLKTRPGLSGFQGRRFASSVSRAIRIYPHENPSEGFFIAKLRKQSGFGRSRIRKPIPRADPKPVQAQELLTDYLGRLRALYGLPAGLLEEFSYWLGSDLSICAPGLRDFPLFCEPVRMGLPLAHIKWDCTKLTTEGSHLIGHRACRSVVDLTSWGELQAYVNREPLTSAGPRASQVLVGFEGQLIGHASVDNGQLLSRFPRAGWRFCLGDPPGA